MSAAFDQRVREIFDAALEQPQSRRWAFVDAASAGEDDVRREVLSLLAALEEGGDRLESGAAAHLTDAVSDPFKAPASMSDVPHGGLRIGGFTLLRLIGTGAMGSVYQARQDNPQRIVAIKVMRTWACSPSGRRRFVEEAQILARLQHPGIAQVFAAGSHSFARGADADSAIAEVLGAGQAVPWIAMEFIEEARTVTAYANDHGLDVRQRLALMIDICDAVHHGHIRGIIHRDLKPANLLVSSAGRVKVIDFGVARAAGGGGQENITLTGAGTIVGTLGYMSPEQCDGDPGAIDTRSDIYSLGVVLYELMTRRLPYTLGSGTFTEAVRTIQTAAPVPPSIVDRSLRGDLERIVLKAMAKDRELRYASASDLAADLRHWLADEPITAHPARLGYRAMKFARRNRAVVALAGLAGLAVLGGAIGVAVGFARAIHAERRAEARRIDAERSAYIANIVAADSAINAQDGGAAVARLDAAPASLRGWEWRFLRSQADQCQERWLLPDGAGESALAPDGTCVVTCLSDQTVACLDTPFGVERWRITGLSLSGQLPRFSPDGSLVFVPCQAAAVVISTIDGQIRRRVECAPGILSLGGAFSPDNRLCAVTWSGGDGLRVYDLESGDLRYQHRSDAWVYSPDFTGDGQWLVTSEAGVLVVRDAATGSTLRRLTTGRTALYEPSPVRVSPDGSRAAVAVGTTIELHSLRSDAPPVKLVGHQQRIHAVAFDSSGDRLISGSVDKTTRIWDLTGKSEPRVLLGSASAVNSVGFAEKSGKALAWSIGTDARVRWWPDHASVRWLDASCGQQGFFVRNVSMADDASLIAAVCGRRGFLWPTPPRPGEVLAVELPAYRAAIDPTSSRFFVEETADRVTMRLLPSQELGWSLPMAGAPEPNPKLSPDNALLAVEDAELRAVVIQTRDARVISRTLPHSAYVTCLDFGHDNRILFTACRDGLARSWDVQSGRKLAAVETPGQEVTCVAGDQHSTLAASGGADERVHLWDARTGQVVRVLEGFHSTVWSLAISPDGTRLAVGSQDRLARVFDIRTGDELLQLRGHTGTVMVVSWSRDGRWLLTGSYDQRVGVWDSGSLGPNPL